MKITLTSTSEANEDKLRELLPAEAVPIVLDLFNALDQLKATKQADSARTAGQCYSAQRQLLVLAALDNASLCARLRMVHPRYRATEVIKHLSTHRDRYGLAADDALPTRELVNRVLAATGYR